MPFIPLQQHILGAPASVPAGSTYPVKLEVNYDYDLFDEKLAHDFKVKPVETEFIKLEEKMRSVANELAAMVQNEAAMRSINGTPTNTYNHPFILSYFTC